MLFLNRRGFAVLLALGLVIPAAQAAPKPAQKAVPPAKQFNLGVTKIPAGAVGNFVVIFASQGPMAALPVEENKQIWVPVSGQVGAVNLPSGTMLVGRFNRIDDTSGNFSFDSMVVNNQVYKMQAMSAPVQGKLRADPYSLQTPQDAKDLAKSSIRERRGTAQGRATRNYAYSGGGLLGAMGAPWQAGLALGALGGIVGTAQETDAVTQATNQQEAVLDRKIPSILVTELAPLQSLSVQFQTDVDLSAPVTQLPTGVQPGMMMLPNAPTTPAAAYPVSPVGPYPTYPGSYGYPYPVAPQPVPVYPGVNP